MNQFDAVEQQKDGKKKYIFVSKMSKVLLLKLTPLHFFF